MVLRGRTHCDVAVAGAPGGVPGQARHAGRVRVVLGGVQGDGAPAPAATACSGAALRATLGAVAGPRVDQLVQSVPHAPRVPLTPGART